MALIAQEFRGPERATAIAVWGSTVGGAVAIGPLLGGLLTDGLGWQWIFYVNLPVGALAVAVALTRMRESRDPSSTRLDLGGLLTFSGALFLLIFGLSRGNGRGLVEHADRGSHYAAAIYTQTLQDHGVLASVGSAATPWTVRRSGRSDWSDSCSRWRGLRTITRVAGSRRGACATATPARSA